METAPNYTAFTVYTSIEDDYIQYHATPIAILDSSVHITIYPHLPDDVYQVAITNIIYFPFNAHIIILYTSSANTVALATLESTHRLESTE